LRSEACNLRTLAVSFFIPAMVAAYLLLTGSAFWAFTKRVDPAPSNESPVHFDQEISSPDAKLICQCLTGPKAEHL